MELRLLGKTGIKVSELCLGTMTFGNEADEDTSIELVNRYLEAGGNFIDTADVYTRGRSEEIVGKALAGAKRDRIILATKGRMAMGDDPNDSGASRRYLTRAVDASLARLQTDWIDLYQIHWPDPSVPLEETLSTLDTLVRAGKIRYAGVSNFLGSHLQRASDLTERYGWTPVVSHQPQYSLISREIEQETLPWCAQHGVAVLPWSPLGGGILSGKYRGGEPPAEGTRLSSAAARAWKLSEHNLAVADTVRTIADEVGHSSAQVALNWVLHRPGVTAPIIGARTHEQLKDNLGAAGWQLGAEHVETLTKASDLPLPYPHDMYRMLKIN